MEPTTDSGRNYGSAIFAIGPQLVWSPSRTMSTTAYGLRLNVHLLQAASPPRRKPQQAGLLAARVHGLEEASLPSVKAAQGR